MAHAYLVLVHTIECKKLNEGGDEIYYAVDDVEHRPSGDPDYWSFEKVGQRRPVHRVVLDGADGASARVSLREQDGFGQFDRMGEVIVKIAGGAVAFDETSGTTYVGRRQGLHVVDFHGAAGVYSIHFDARATDPI